MMLHHRLGAVTAGAVTAATIATLFTGVGVAYADDGPVEAGITVAKIDGLPADFINGVDVSSILSEEESGVVFRDFAGNPADPFHVLADAGINYVRVRVWNDPYNAEGDGYGAGNTDADRATEIADRATRAGMRVLVDFHYSDFWADPGKQKAPKAWAAMTVEQKATAAHDFTEDTLTQMDDLGVDVGMVQVGNETNGMVAGVSGIPNMAQIFAAGSEAVRDVYPEALVAVHFTNPESAGRYAGYASQLQAAGLDYDVFASSYYPYWHGTLANLTSVLSSVATTYDKKVMVAETSYLNTLADGDGTTNSVTAVTGEEQYPVSVQGQATEIRNVMAAVNAVPDGAGLGVFYWEPAWIPVPGATLAERQAKWAEFGSGWATTAAAEYDAAAPTVNAEGSGWDNQALFGVDGTPLESLRAFAYARTGAVAPLAVVSVESPTVTVTEGGAFALPSTVEVAYNDFTTEDVAVTWDDILAWITSPGTYTVNGVTADGDATTATVMVNAANYLLNPGFETTPNVWTSTGAGITVRATDDPRTGTRSTHFYNGSAATYTLEQTVTGLTPGDYVATGQFQGGASGAGDTRTLSLTSNSVTQSTPFELNGWTAWFKATTPVVTVGVDGTATVRVDASLSAGAWGTMDDFELIKAPATPADTSELEARVDQLNGITREVYSEDSLEALDAALEVANIVLAASVPTEQQVADALELLGRALDGLVVVGEVPAPTVGAVAVSVVDGDAIVLPVDVTVTAFDGRKHQEAVTWDNVLSWIDGPGTYVVRGTTEGDLAATATITVTERNWVVNGSFEDADTSMWAIEGAGASIGASSDSSDGARSISFWLDSDYTFVVAQQITGLPAGSYVLSATTQGGDSPDTDTRYITLLAGVGGQSADATLAGWQAFETATTAPVEVGEDGIATVNADFTLTANAWGTIDDFRLVRVAEDADTEGLEDVVAQAQAIDRALYEPESLAALDAALAAALIVLDADAPSQETVNAAGDQLVDALMALDLIDVPFTAMPVPTISGTVKVGSTLTVVPGAWAPTPTEFAYAWLRNGVPIPGATNATYKVTSSDVAKKLSVTVTASRADTVTASKTSSQVTVPLQKFVVAKKPSIAGSPVAGAKLTAYVGIWAPTPSAVKYQWYRNGATINGATSKYYTVKSSDLGKKLTVKVTASRTGFETTSATSSSVTVVKRFSSTGYASITGTARVGHTLTGHRGIWRPTPSSYSFQWYRNGVAIPGATSTTYKLKSIDRGKKVVLKVTAKKSGYLPTSDFSSAVTVR